MQEQAVAEAPRWITVIALALCSLVAIGVLLIAVVSGYYTLAFFFPLHGQFC